jgi:hypothetical protein
MRKKGGSADIKVIVLIKPIGERKVKWIEIKHRA